MISLGNFIVVIDSCVLIKANVRDLLLRIAEKELYQPRWTDEILNEVYLNLIEERGLQEHKSKKLVNTIKEVFPEALVSGYKSILSKLKINEKDKHVLAAAVKSNAQVIITDNLKDFSDKYLEGFGIEVQSPDEFLVDLFDLAPDIIIEIFKQQVKSLNNPVLSEDEVLLRLKSQLPEFADVIKKSLVSVK